MAQESNQRVPSYVADRAAELLNHQAKPLNGANVLLMGVTYKKDIADVRESPVPAVAGRLLVGGEFPQTSPRAMMLSRPACATKITSASVRAGRDGRHGPARARGAAGSACPELVPASSERPRRSSRRIPRRQPCGGTGTQDCFSLCSRQPRWEVEAMKSSPSRSGQRDSGLDAALHELTRINS